MVIISVPIPEQHVTLIANALRANVENADVLTDAQIIETFARNTIASLVVQYAGTLAVAQHDAVREQLRKDAQAAAQAAMDEVLSAASNNP